VNEFFVDRYRVDMLRSQIVDESAVASVEPKALAVLLLLAKHQGEVVKHEQILNAVWPGVVVEPNALQRSIAQLRKAFGDNAKEQKIIATYPKVGYSLVANVDWETDLVADKTVQKEQVPEVVQASSVASIRPIVRILLLAAAITLFLIVFWLHSNKGPHTEAHFQYQSATPLTATDETEFYASFSPNGRYLAFSRFNRSCQNQLWAKDLESQREFLLTEKLGFYGTPAWSPDGRSLAYTQRRGCESDEPQETCMELRSLNFTLAKNRPQESTLLLGCGEESYDSAQWLDPDTLAFVTHGQDSSAVKRLSLKNLENVETLYASDNRPYHISYSQRLNRLAIVEHDLELNNHLVLVGSGESELKRRLIQFPDLMQYRHWWWPSWHPLEDFLVAANTSSLLKISLDGTVSVHAIPSSVDVFHPKFHPAGDKFVATTGRFDSDIFELSWAPSEQTPVSISPAIFRSTVLDWGAQYQPGGAAIALVSKRSGSQQVWLSENGFTNADTNTDSLRKFSHLPESGAWVSFSWSRDGRLLAYTANGTLYLQGLSDTRRDLDNSLNLERDIKVEQVLQWLGDEQLLLHVIDDHGRKLIRFDLSTGEIFDYAVAHEHLGEKSFWAQIDEETGRLYLRGMHSLIYFQLEQSLELVPGIDRLKTKGKFFIESGQITFADEKGGIFIFDRTTHHSRLLTHVLDLQSIEDVNLDEQRLLFSKVMGAYKQLVLFH
jgi:DNA-binding winged helix-turn-helix (wHTH) protein